MRLFFALDPSRTLKEGLIAFQASHPALPWTDPWRLHLTLAFLGELPEERLPSLREIGTRVAECCAPLTLRTAELGGFQRPSRARVLWLGVEKNPALESLAAGLREALQREGLPLDGKPFAAHLTVARFRVPTDIAFLEPAPEPLVFQVPELVLLRSHLGPQGSRYERICAFPFQG